MDVEEGGEICAPWREQDLRAAGEFLEAFVAVLLARIGIVHVRITFLVEA